jgi:hypothetical protein
MRTNFAYLLAERKFRRSSGKFLPRLVAGALVV